MANDHFLEDLTPGLTWTSGSLTVEADAIKSFAADYDRQPFHLDEAAAEATFFRGLAASGWQVAALSMRLLTEGEIPFAWGIVGAGGEITWPRPTRPGDRLTVHTEVLEVTRSKSRPDRGIVTVRNETRNQDGEAVQVLVAKLVVPSREKRPAA
ncbi:MAG: MaoC family dehydratase [Phyllobacteriaceae bacterium]|nr:MaoC family dehydratase [Phyllobacteriaceae bacterium]